MSDSTAPLATVSNVSTEASESPRWAVPPDKKHSNAQPLWQLILFDFITFGLYFIYWSYRNWKHLKDYKNLDINPGKKALALLIPLIGIAFVFEQFDAFKKFSEEAGAKTLFSPGWLTIGLIVFNAISWLPDPFWLLSFLSVVPIALVQRSLNSAWANAEPGLSVRKLPTIGDLLAVIASWVVLVILSMIFA